MTRFARAKGSKAANERRVEDPTPWHVMRQQLADQLSNGDQKQEKDNIPFNLKEYLNNNQDKKEVWSDINEFKDKSGEQKQQNMEREAPKQKKLKKKIIQSNYRDECSESSGNTSEKGLVNPGYKNTEVNLESCKYKQNGSDYKVNVNSSEKRKRIKPTCNKLIQENKKIEKSEEIVNVDNSDNCKKRKRIKPTSNKLNQGNNKIKNSEETITTKQKFKNIDKNKPSKDLATQESNQSKQVKTSIVLENSRNVEEICGSQEKSKKPNSFFSNWKNQNNFHTIIANGREIKVVSFEGFLIKKDDASELRKLRQKLRSQNVPKEKIKVIMKLERRKAEKALAREKTNVCFHCRKFGHKFSDCPDIKDTELSKSGICFKCGSTEHSHFQCKVLQSQGYRYAVCFVCKEQGHIARQCPLNPQGQYPKGGSCHLCGEVTHLKKDCPKAVDTESSKTNGFTVEKLNDSNLEDIGEVSSKSKDSDIKKNRVIKF